MLSPTSLTLFLTRRHSIQQKRFVFIDESNSLKLSSSFFFFCRACNMYRCVFFLDAFCFYSLYGSRYPVQESFLHGSGIPRLTK